MTMQGVLASSREHLVKVPCSGNLKVNNATRDLALHWGWIPDTNYYYYQLNFSFRYQSNWPAYLIFIYFICKSTSQQWNEMDPSTHPLHLKSDIQRKVISARIVSNPRFPLSAPVKWMNGWPTLNRRLLGSNVKQRGNVKRSALGECSLRKDTLEWKLRMKVGFHHKFVGRRTSRWSQLLNWLTQLISLPHFPSGSKWTNRLTINFISTVHFY